MLYQVKQWRFNGVSPSTESIIDKKCAIQDRESYGKYKICASTG